VADIHDITLMGTYYRGQRLPSLRRDDVRFVSSSTAIKNTLYKIT